MAVGDLNDGSKFGLPAIGLPQAHLDTDASDTARRQLPGLAVAHSVFAWITTPQAATLPLLATRTAAAGGTSDVINLRANTAPGGISVDVPTWAAGAVVEMLSQVDTMGTSTYHGFQILAPLAPGIAAGKICRLLVKTAVSPSYEWDQVIVPFFDEPLVTVGHISDGNGTGSFEVRLLGFVRNV